MPTAGALGRRCGGCSRWYLRSTTTTRALEDHAELLLLGYSPWGKRITHLMTRIAEAATTLHDMGSTVAFTATAIGLKGFCIVLFVYGTEHAYHGLHTK